MKNTKILVCNAGSTSLKFKLYEMPEGTVLAEGKAERVGSPDDAIFSYHNRKTAEKVLLKNQCVVDYRSGIRKFLDYLLSPDLGVIKESTEIERVGYKTVLSKGHFGIHELNAETVQGMKDWISLAPVHNTAYIQAIEAMRSVLPEAVFVGCFETNFHKDIPLYKKIYGVPYQWYEKYGVQRLGYHGASHGYIAEVLKKIHKGIDYRAISCHLGGSASVCAIKDGKSLDTSFGMSLQTGLIHSTRSGDMDCDLYEFLRSEGLSDQEIHAGISQCGGLLGISGVSGDIRYIQEAMQHGNERAQLALDAFVNGIVNYIGSFYVCLEGLDDLVFTAGIGENSATIRKMVCDRLKVLGIIIDNEKNQKCRGFCDISDASSKVRVLVIPTDEEFGIAKSTYEYVPEPG